MYNVLFLAIFGGDFNEDFHPLRILAEEMGMCDVFESLDLPPPITHPMRSVTGNIYA